MVKHYAHPAAGRTPRPLVSGRTITTGLTDTRLANASAAPDTAGLCPLLCVAIALIQAKPQRRPTTVVICKTVPGMPGLTLVTPSVVREVANRVVRTCRLVDGDLADDVMMVVSRTGPRERSKSDILRSNQDRTGLNQVSVPR